MFLGGTRLSHLFCYEIRSLSKIVLLGQLILFHSDVSIWFLRLRFTEHRLITVEDKFTLRVEVANIIEVCWHFSVPLL